MGTFVSTVSHLFTVALLNPRNLRVSDEWYTRFRVAWNPVSAPVEGYRLAYSPAGETSDSPGPDGFMYRISPQSSLPPPGSAGPPVDLFVGDITSYTLHNLQPGTTYDVSVVAQYTGGKSGALAGQGTTREGTRAPEGTAPRWWNCSHRSVLCSVPERDQH